MGGLEVSLEIMHDMMDHVPNGRMAISYQHHRGWGCIIKTVIMMTSSNGNISTLLALCVGNPPVTGRVPHKGQSWRALMFPLM